MVAPSFEYHVIALKTNGTIWSWGRNDNYSQLGHKDFVNRSSPVQIGTLSNWTSVGVGGFQTFAINSSGELYVWGANNSGQLGFGHTLTVGASSTNSPIQIGTETTWSDVWATSNRTYGTKTDGTLWGWGAATNYLGDTLASNVGTPTFPTTPTTRYSPTQIGTKTTWSKLGRGQNHITGQC